MPTRASPATIARLRSSSDQTSATILKSSVFSNDLSSRRLSSVRNWSSTAVRTLRTFSVDGVTEHEQLDHRDEQREEEGRGIANDVEQFLSRHRQRALQGEAVVHAVGILLRRLRS